MGWGRGGVVCGGCRLGTRGAQEGCGGGVDGMRRARKMTGEEWAADEQRMGDPSRNMTKEERADHAERMGYPERQSKP